MSSATGEIVESSASESSELQLNLLPEAILEARIAELEKKIFGLEGKPDLDKLPETTVIDNLASINTMYSSALSGREKINNLIHRLPELESYMEADFEPTDLQTESKLEYILAMEPEVRENINHLKKLKELLPALDSDRFNNLPELSEKLNKLTVSYIKLGDEADQLDTQTRDAITRYNDIIMNISKTLITMDAEISNLEKAAEPKKVVD